MVALQRWVREGKTVPIHENESDSAVSFWCLVLCTCRFTCQTKNSRQTLEPDSFVYSTSSSLHYTAGVFHSQTKWNSPHHPSNWLHRLSIQQSKIESLLYLLSPQFFQMFALLAALLAYTSIWIWLNKTIFLLIIFFWYEASCEQNIWNWLTTKI